MDKIFLRRYLPAMLLLLGFALVWSTRSQREVPLAAPLSTVLPELTGYNVKDQVIGEEEKKVAGMTDYVARLFWTFDGKDSTAAFTTYVGYYDRQQQGHTMHSPRNCLPGAGWEILRADTGAITVAGNRHVVNKYLLKNGVTQALVFYWYQGRGRVVASEYAVKWNLLRDAALKGHTEEALVRIVVYVPKANLMDPAALERAYRDAQTLGESVGVRLLADVQRVLPKTGDETSEPKSASLRTGEQMLATSAR
ncbi:MAG: exosortase C-terminal domain/associated protein EpsI [bacterium]